MNNSIIICPNVYRKNFLKDISLESKFNTSKLMSRDEFFDRALFSYDEKTIYYLMKKYNYSIDVCKVYLKNMKFIENIEYKNSKLVFLRDLKKELINEGLLYFDSLFSKYIKNKNIEVTGIYDLDLYEEILINNKLDINNSSLNTSVFEFNTMEEEINNVCLNIIDLVNHNIQFENIYLCNVDSDYYFLLEKMFSYYHIPINIPYRNSIYSTKIVQKYLRDGVTPSDDNEIVKLLYDSINKVAELNDDEIKRKILIDILKHTYIPNKKIDNAVVVGNLYDYVFSDNDYVFVLGFNLDSLPRTYKDIEFITDEIKDEVYLYSTKELNNREKNYLASILSNIKNLTISYKLSSSFKKYYPSNMIDEYNLSVKHVSNENLCYSNIYNKISLGERLDLYYLYGEKDSTLESLLYHYNDFQYNTYDHKFSGIDKDLYLTNISYPLRISYSSLNAFYECPFKYYCQYVLKLSLFEDSFAAYIGSLYHHILSLYKRNGFSLDYEWNKYLEKRNLSLKETLLLVRIRKNLEDLISKLDEQRLFTSFNDELYEKELKVVIRDDVLVEFIGYVDKIMFYSNVSDTYFAIVDYKSGIIDTHIEPMKYGLHMQLPIYLFLIEYSKIFDNSIFCGIYYQNILFSYPTWSREITKLKNSQYLLNGYSTCDTNVLEKFDLTYKDSSLIKGMSYSEDKGFSRYSKVLDVEDLNNLIEYTKKKINEGVDSIINAKFYIEPKVYGKNNISCTYCRFKDICFCDNDDLKYLDEAKDLSFLGGEK